jgi:hypothetical protein
MINLKIVRTEDRTPVKRDPESREWWQGWWETTVCWLEVTDDEESEDLVQVEATFYSDAERSAYLEERIQSGYMYDILWLTETSLGGKGHPNVPQYSEEEWEMLFAGTSRKVSEDAVTVV